MLSEGEVKEGPNVGVSLTFRGPFSPGRTPGFPRRTMSSSIHSLHNLHNLHYLLYLLHEVALDPVLHSWETGSPASPRVLRQT